MSKPNSTKITYKKAIKKGEYYGVIRVEDTYGINSLSFGANEDSADTFEDVAWEMRKHLGVDPVPAMLEAIDAQLSKEQELILIKALISRLKP